MRHPKSTVQHHYRSLKLNELLFHNYQAVSMVLVAQARDVAGMASVNLNVGTNSIPISFATKSALPNSLRLWVRVAVMVNVKII